MGRLHLFALSPAQRRILLFEDIENRIGKPGVMPELKRELVGSRQKTDEVRDQRQIGLEVGRSLNQNRPQPSRLAQQIETLKKAAQRRLAILQPAEMGDHLVDLGGKPETGCGGGNPVLLRRRVGETPKGQIEFHRVQLRGVILQEPLRRKLVRIKPRLPGRIRPAGCTNMQGHGAKYSLVGEVRSKSSTAKDATGAKEKP